LKKKTNNAVKEKGQQDVQPSQHVSKGQRGKGFIHGVRCQVGQREDGVIYCDLVKKNGTKTKEGLPHSKGSHKGRGPEPVGG